MKKIITKATPQQDNRSEMLDLTDKELDAVSGGYVIASHRYTSVSHYYRSSYRYRPYNYGYGYGHNYGYGYGYGTRHYNRFYENCR